MRKDAGKMPSFGNSICGVPLRALLVVLVMILSGRVASFSHVPGGTDVLNDRTTEQISCSIACNSDAEIPVSVMSRPSCSQGSNSHCARRLPGADGEVMHVFGDILCNGYRSVPVLQTETMVRRFHMLCVLRL